MSEPVIPKSMHSHRAFLRNVGLATGAAATVAVTPSTADAKVGI